MPIHLLISHIVTYIYIPHFGLVDKAPSYRLDENELKNVKMHVVWSVLFDSVSWHLTIEGNASPRGIVSPSPCGALNLRPKILHYID